VLGSEESFRQMREVLTLLIWLGEPHGHCLHVNRMLRESIHGALRCSKILAVRRP